MSGDIDLRCDPHDPEGLLDEIRRRDKIITALMNQVQRNLNNPNNEFALLQRTFVLEQEVDSRTSELQRALEALAAANRNVEAAWHMLSASIDSISEGFAIYDLDDRLVLCNQAYKQIGGFTSNIAGRAFTDLMTENAKRIGADENWIARRLKEHRAATGTSEHHMAGRILQIRERKTPDGYTVGVYADITELAEAEAFRATRQQLLNIIDFLPDATFVVDANRKVIAWNLAMEQLTGVSKESVIGRGDYVHGAAFYGERRPTLLDLFDSDDAALSSRFENFRRNSGTLYGEDYVPRAFGGRGAYLSRTASRLLDSEGKVVGAIESVRDLTESKRAESELQSIQVQLRQSAKMEAIGRLAGGIAHDFNNQLTLVQGYCQLLLDGLPASMHIRNYAAEIQRAAERSAQLTRQLLAFSRNQVLASEVLDLRAVLAKLHDPLARMIGEDIDIELNIAPTIWRIEADQNQLEQAIINLAINARDAMPHGGKLTVDARNCLLDEDYALRHTGADVGEFVCLSVRDTGTGMDEPTLRKIFEPFFTTKPVGAGTGLGLSMVYGFVKQSGGHIEVTSQQGRGSSFELFFPRSVAHAEAPCEPIDESAAEAGSETILVIEDQESLLELTSHILRTGGYKVLEARDGETAIRINREYNGLIQLALCDVVMPGLTGPETAQVLRRDRPDLPIVFVTGYSERAIEPELAGPGHILSKPFTPDALFKVVRKVLNESDSRRCA